MPQAVYAMKDEGKRDDKFGCNLGRNWPCSKASSQDGGFQVPSKRGRDQIGHAIDVEDTANGNAGDTVKHRGYPCDLRSVDGEMWRYGSVQTLLCEWAVLGRIVAGHRGEGLSTCGAVSLDVRVSTVRS
jgi:hypothetical protein